MQDFGGPESFSSPSEGVSQAAEGVSESAKQRFAQSQQQIKQIAKEEKKARKRDDRVAKTILQFLSDDRYSHLFQLIARLVARDCPSVFIVAILSLIHAGSRETIEEYIAEQKLVIEKPKNPAELKKSGLPPEVSAEMLLWTTRLELVLSVDAVKILSKLMVDEGNIDGSVLQLTTFVIVDFFEQIGRPVSYEDLQPLTIKVLQDLIEPHIDEMQEYFEKLRKEAEGPKDDEE